MNTSTIKTDFGFTPNGDEGMKFFNDDDFMLLVNGSNRNAETLSKAIHFVNKIDKRTKFLVAAVAGLVYLAYKQSKRIDELNDKIDNIEEEAENARLFDDNDEES